MRPSANSSSVMEARLGEDVPRQPQGPPQTRPSMARAGSDCAIEERAAGHEALAPKSTASGKMADGRAGCCGVYRQEPVGAPGVKPGWEWESDVMQGSWAGDRCALAYSASFQRPSPSTSSGLSPPRPCTRSRASISFLSSGIAHRLCGLCRFSIPHHGLPRGRRGSGSFCHASDIASLSLH